MTKHWLIISKIVPKLTMDSNYEYIMNRPLRFVLHLNSNINKVLVVIKMTKSIKIMNMNLTRKCSFNK